MFVGICKLAMNADMLADIVILTHLATVSPLRRRFPPPPGNPPSERRRKSVGAPPNNFAAAAEYFLTSDGIIGITCDKSFYASK